MSRKTNILTPENISLEYELAGIGTRGAAVIIDTLIQAGSILLLVFIGLAIATYTSSVSEKSFDRMIQNNWFLAFLVIVANVIYMGYFLLFELFMRGQTPGKRVLKIQVIMDDGRALTTGAVLIRNILRLADSFLGTYWLGMIVSFSNGLYKRTGDIAAGTMVIKLHTSASSKELTLSAEQPQAQDPPQTDSPFLNPDDDTLPSYTPVKSQLSLAHQQLANRLDAADVDSIRFALKRFPSVPEPFSSGLAADLANTVSRTMGIQLQDTTLAPVAFLTEVVQSWDNRNKV